jgi:hypothetical protein
LGIERSYDPELMAKALDMAHNPANTDIDHRMWLLDRRNIMFHENGNVGLATFEYPGVYNIHWFFEDRGRAAIKMAHRMMDKFFQDYGAEAIRGLTPMDNKAARWLARQVGLTSYGTIECITGTHELFCMTRDDFYINKEDKN